MKAVLIVQDLHQLEKAYGPNSPWQCLLMRSANAFMSRDGSPARNAGDPIDDWPTGRLQAAD
jgi:hypothetical protein